MVGALPAAEPRLRAPAGVESSHGATRRYPSHCLEDQNRNGRHGASVSGSKVIGPNRLRRALWNRLLLDCARPIAGTTSRATYRKSYSCRTLRPQPLPMDRATIVGPGKQATSTDPVNVSTRLALHRLAPAQLHRRRAHAVTHRLRAHAPVQSPGDPFSPGSRRSRLGSPLRPAAAAADRTGPANKARTGPPPSVQPPPRPPAYSFSRMASIQFRRLSSRSRPRVLR